MGRSSFKGNSGFLGLDKRGQYSGTTVGNVSVQKHYLERRLGHLGPIVPAPPTNLVLFEDDFSTGDLSKWNVVNGSEPSIWEVNTSASTLNSAASPIEIPSGSTYAAFISNDSGTTNNYSDNSNSHMYFDITIPATATDMTLTFDWMCFGERSASGFVNYDFGYIMLCPQTFTPVAGTEYDDAGTGSPLTWERLISGTTAPNVDGGRFTSDSVSDSRNPDAGIGFVQETITIDSSLTNWCTDCDRRIVFSWTSDTSIQDDPAFTIANIVLKYTE